MSPKKSRQKFFPRALLFSLSNWLKSMVKFVLGETVNSTFLFVDGSNLYGAQFELFGPGKFLDFADFIAELEKKLNFSFDKIFFYASYSPKPKNPTKNQKEYLKNEGLFYQSVRKTPNCTFFKGYRSPTSGKEKEVDVKLTADLVHQAHLNRDLTVFLFTGDADFLQALFLITPLCRKINLLCFQNKIMFKGVFYFQTILVRFNRQKINLNSKRKPIFFDISSKDVVRLI